MPELNQIEEIKKTINVFFEKMTMSPPEISVNFNILQDSQGNIEKQEAGEGAETVNIDLKSSEPQIIIGQQGQTLLDIQRILRMILNKKLARPFYLNIDINDYKKKKIEYLKDLARTLADQVSLSKEEKSLSPMSSYERRIIHEELSKRTDVVTESRGEGLSRRIIIKPR